MQSGAKDPDGLFDAYRDPSSSEDVIGPEGAVWRCAVSAVRWFRAAVGWGLVCVVLRAAQCSVGVVCHLCL